MTETETETERYAEADAMADHGQRFAPIRSSIPDLRSLARFIPNVLVGSRRAMQAEPVDAPEFFEDEEDVGELLSQRPAPTPNGKWVAIAMDACAQIQELQRCIANLDFFSAGDTGLSELTQQAEKAKSVLIRAGVRP